MPRFVPLVAVLFLAPLGRGEPPSAEPIHQWIRDLDDSSYRKRDEATKQLRQAGPDGVADLAKAAKPGSTESPDRAMRALGEMAAGSDAKAEAAARRQLRR